jgi:hypothetical protein
MSTTTQKCSKCKKAKDLEQFVKNGKPLKTCFDCREKTRLKKLKIISAKMSDTEDTNSICTKCKEVKPNDQFTKGDKVLKTCQTCREKKQLWQAKNKEDLEKCEKEGKDWAELKEENKKNFKHPNKIEHRIINKQEHKHCCTCKEWKLLTDFNNSKTTWDKLRPGCKDCCKGYRETIQDKLDEIVTCEICEKEIKFRSLYDHNRNLHSDETYKWKCDDCCITFKHKKTLLRHYKTESHQRLVNAKAIDNTELEERIKEMGGKPILQDQEKCHICYKSFDTDDLEEHIASHETTFPCDKCDKEFVSQYKLNRHITRVHSEQTYPCTICEEVFSRSDTLKRHIKQVHDKNEEDTVECEQCHKVMTRRNYKERHIQLCTLNSLIDKYPGASKWERLVSKYLIDKKIEFQMQKAFCDLKKTKCLPYDFYLSEQNILIEVHGKFHYELSNYRNAEEIFARNQEVDKLKVKYAKKNKIPLIIINTQKYNTFKKITTFLDENI